MFKAELGVGKFGLISAVVDGPGKVSSFSINSRFYLITSKACVQFFHSNGFNFQRLM